jgi:NADH dehydrogenase
VAEAAARDGVEQFIHLSAIGARDDATYPYLYSKWQGEQAVIQSGVPYTILRPSILFGPGDGFVNVLAGLVRVFPVVPVAGSGKNTFQPMAVEDLARCVAGAAGRADLLGKVIEVGGPDHLSYNDILDAVVRACKTRRLKLHVPSPAVRLAVRLMEALLANPPATTEQLRMLAVPNVAGLKTVEETFGFKPRPLPGNIEYVRKIGFWDGLRMSLGPPPRHIRDH